MERMTEAEVEQVLMDGEYMLKHRELAEAIHKVLPRLVYECRTLREERDALKVEVLNQRKAISYWQKEGGRLDRQVKVLRRACDLAEDKLSSGDCSEANVREALDACTNALSATPEEAE